MPLFAEGMSEGTWVAIIGSALALIGTIASNINTRNATRDKLELEAKAARDKLEIEAQVARDKLEFDAKLTDLEVKHADCEGKHLAIAVKLADCEKQHVESAKDREQLSVRMDALEAKVA